MGRKNERLKSMLWMVGLCFLLPHTVLSWMEVCAGTVAQWPGVRVQAMWVLFIYGGIPFWSAVIALRHVQRGGRFSAALMGEIIAIVASFIPRMGWESLIIVACAVPLTFAMECFGILADYENAPNGLLAGAARNRGFLATACFWSLGILFLILMVMRATGGVSLNVAGTVMFLGFPALLYCRSTKHLENQSLSLGGWLGMIPMALVSLLLALPLGWICFGITAGGVAFLGIMTGIELWDRNREAKQIE